MSTRVAIVGMGFVGSHMLNIFPHAAKIDPPRGLGEYGDTEGCALSIICVPTPMRADGSCDTSIVEDAVSKVRSPLILVRSTVTPGTCDHLAERVTRSRVVFAPEYMGESRYWTPPQFPQPRDPVGHGFMILGGEDADCSAVADIFLPVLGPATRFRFMTRMEAEIVKYAENAFFALKVTFANELRRICESSGVNYHRVREGWLDDPRVGPMHTAAFHDAPGFDGKCLPKDTSALAHYCRALGLDPVLLDAVLRTNHRNLQRAR